MAKDKYILSKKYLFVLFLLIIGNTSWAQCLTSSLVINTGYNTITAAAIPGGANGATPVPDPHWIVTAISPGTSAAIAATPIPGLIAVVPGNAADIIQTLTGAWVANPAANPGGWISCVNSNTYNDPGTGVPLTMTLGRPFRMCTADSVRLSFNIASDNFTSAANIDGTIILPTPTTGYAAYTVYTQTVWLTAGTHTINIVVNNQNVTSVSSNPTGLNVYGTVSSATGTNSIVSESYVSCNTYVCGSSCNTLALADSLHLCEQTSGSITATMTGTDPILSIAWTPITGLSNSTILNPTISVGSTSGYYYITVQSLRPYNLVYNGDFSLGNTGFNSTYTYQAPPSTNLPEGRYSVHTNPNGVHSGFTSFGDHTTGTGRMMILNGSPTPTSVWCQTIPVTPNTDYDFSSWFANCSASSSGGSAPILQFMVNGILLGTPTTVTAAPGVWMQFHTIWNSGANTTAQICIYDNNTVAGGNDFVIDDISFQQICTARDSIYVDVNLVDTTYQHTDDSVCAPITTTTLTAPAGYSSYLWNTGASTTSISVSAYGAYWVYAKGTCAMLIDTFLVSVKHVDTTFTHADSNVCASATSVTLVAPPGFASYTWNTGATGSTLTVTAAGNYWVYAPGPCTMLVDTFHVKFNPLPVVNLGNDTGFCAGNTIILYSSQPLGTTYQWSTGSTTDSIHVSATGTYWLHVSNGCDATDTINILVNPAPIVDLGPDTNNCQGNAVPLQSNITYVGATYLWNTGATTPSIVVTTTGKYWLQVNSNTGCSGADTINVEILYDTVTLHTNDTAICKGQSMQVSLTGNPLLNTYQWLPTTGIPNPFIGNPTIFGDTSAMYIVTAHFPGCPDIIDSFFLDVQPNPIVAIQGTRSRSVCQFDTLHVHVAVSPGWYPSYIYSWTPTANIDFPNNADVVFTAGDSTSLVVDVSTSAGCRSADSIRIDVHPGNFAYVDSLYNVCPGDSVQLKPGGGAVSYSWTPILYIDSPTSVSPWVHPITSETYTVVATSEFGCTDTQTVWISVQPAALIFLEDSVQIYPGESYHIQPQTNCTNFSWWPTVGLKGRFLADPVVTPEVNTKYIVTASTEYGCTVVDSIIVRMSNDALLDMPNAFAPGNGPNNLFKIIKRGIATLNYFRIYDRWGVMVYESTDIDAGWDGTYKGKPQPFGVYVYQIEAVKTSGKQFRKQGNVTLVR